MHILLDKIETYSKHCTTRVFEAVVINFQNFIYPIYIVKKLLNLIVSSIVLTLTLKRLTTEDVI